jgi:hypothetical protein
VILLVCLFYSVLWAGEAAVEGLAAAFASATDGSSSSSLGSCLLGDLPVDFTPEQADAVLEVWPVNKVVALETGADELDALQGLAPTWQPPAGAKKPNKKQIAAIARLRGLVLLGRAAAAVSTPGEVLEVRKRFVLHGAAVAEWH